VAAGAAGAGGGTVSPPPPLTGSFADVSDVSVVQLFSLSLTLRRYKLLV
jgi:hypothetical protein